ncbi:MAG: tetratricopeptide repeat protein [Hyphomonadaceae bacterium]
MRRMSLAALMASVGASLILADASRAAEPAGMIAAAAEDAEAPSAQAETPARPMDALLAADTSLLVAEARRQVAAGEDAGAWAAVIFVDEFTNNRLAQARAALEGMDQGVSGSGADMFEPFLLVAEGRGDFALERLTHGAGGLPDPLPAIARALVLESLGRLPEAGAAYGEIERSLDTRPPPEGEPQSEEDFMRMLTATRTGQTLYRAALVQHRLGRREEAARLYGLVAGFSPNAIDLAANRARLERGEGPAEPALDGRRALGRWLFFLSDYLQQTEGLQAVIEANGNVEGLTSPAGTMFLQLGIGLDPSAEDWALAAASQLVEARGYAGAERILSRIGAQSIYAADANLARATLHIEQNQDQEALAAARRAVQAAGERWTVYAGAGDVFRLAGADAEAIAAQDRALALAPDAEDRASILSFRAFAHRFAGRLDEAARDSRAALALSQDENVRYTAVAILMDHPQAWSEGIAIARAMFAEQPGSSTRLNSLGYALIQRPEGLEEGYRLLWRGFAIRDSDYAIIDSLGWAYYLYGAFDEARVLIERSRDLSANDPNPEVLDHLGDVYWRVNERDLAREAWTQALAARPDAIRRRSLEEKIANGLTAPAPTRRDLPRVDLPSEPQERTET